MRRGDEGANDPDPEGERPALVLEAGRDKGTVHRRPRGLNCPGPTCKTGPRPCLLALGKRQDTAPFAGPFSVTDSSEPLKTL